MPKFVVLCQQLDLFPDAVVAIDGSQCKAVNSSDRNFTDAKLKRRMEKIEASIGRYLAELDSADRQEPACPLKPKCTPSSERRVTGWEHQDVLENVQARLKQTPDAMRIRRCTVEHPYGTLAFPRGSHTKRYGAVQRVLAAQLQPDDPSPPLWKPACVIKQPGPIAAIRE